MSVQTEINRITSAVSAAYTAAQSKGATMPSSQTVGNLATAINSISATGGSGSSASIASYKIVTSFMSSLNLLSIAWSAFGSGVSLSTFTNIFNNHLLYSIIVNDPAENGSGETKLIFDNFNDDDQCLYGHFIYNNKTRYFKADSTGISEVTVASVSVPTKTSQLTNDSGYLTLDTLPTYGGEVE